MCNLKTMDLFDKSIEKEEAICKEVADDISAMIGDFNRNKPDTFLIDKFDKTKEVSNLYKTLKGNYPFNIYTTCMHDDSKYHTVADNFKLSEHNIILDGNMYDLGNCLFIKLSEKEDYKISPLLSFLQDTFYICKSNNNFVLLNYDGTDFSPSLYDDHYTRTLLSEYIPYQYLGKHDYALLLFNNSEEYKKYITNRVVNNFFRYEIFAINECTPNYWDISSTKIFDYVYKEYMTAPINYLLRGLVVEDALIYACGDYSWTETKIEVSDNSIFAIVSDERKFICSLENCIAIQTTSNFTESDKYVFKSSIAHSLIEEKAYGAILLDKNNYKDYNVLLLLCNDIDLSKYEKDLDYLDSESDELFEEHNMRIIPRTIFWSQIVKYD